MEQQPGPPAPPPVPPPPSVPSPSPGGSSPQRPGNPGMAIAGLVVGIVGLLLSWTGPIGFVICAVGAVLSFVGMRKATETGAPRGMAIGGLVCSLVGLVIALILTIVVLTAADEINEGFDDITFTTTTSD